MDPNKTLRRIKEIRKRYGSVRPPDVPRELISLFLDLDDWLSSGGYLPDAWKSKYYVLNATRVMEDAASWQQPESD